MNKKFVVSVDFTYNRDFYVCAESEEEARRIALKLADGYKYDGSNSGYFVDRVIEDCYEADYIAEEDCFSEEN